MMVFASSSGFFRWVLKGPNSYKCWVSRGITALKKISKEFDHGLKTDCPLSEYECSTSKRRESLIHVGGGLYGTTGGGGTADMGTISI